MVTGECQSPLKPTVPSLPSGLQLFRNLSWRGRDRVPGSLLLRKRTSGWLHWAAPAAYCCQLSVCINSHQAAQWTSAALTSGWELFRVDNLSSILLAGGLLDASTDDWEGTPGAGEKKSMNPGDGSVKALQTQQNSWVHGCVTELVTQVRACINHIHIKGERGGKEVTCIFNTVWCSVHGDVRGGRGGSCLTRGGRGLLISSGTWEEWSQRQS